MTVNEITVAMRLFRYVQTIDYIHSGKHCDYRVIKDKENKIVYLIYQDTDGLKDWISNLSWLPIVHKPYRNQVNHLWVHRGFSSVYKSCNDTVMGEFISELDENPDYKPMIVGWSFGGAMAQLAAEDFHFRTGKKAEIITFGAPKIFFGKKSYEYVKTTMNGRCYCHISDLITKCVPLYGFRRFETTSIGYDGWKFWRLLNPWRWHCEYDIIINYLNCKEYLSN